MEKSIVALVKCTSYEQETVSSAVEQGVDLLGGIESFVTKSEKILCKPNVLAGDDPARCVTTHPAVLEAVVRLLGKVTSHISVGDSPGGGEPIAAIPPFQKSTSSTSKAPSK